MYGFNKAENGEERGESGCDHVSVSEGLLLKD